MIATKMQMVSTTARSVPYSDAVERVWWVWFGLGLALGDAFGAALVGASAAAFGRGDSLAAA
ncbi:MAG: hypothetical protein WCP28_15285, partial [Actinomycetes bacterium]